MPLDPESVVVVGSGAVGLFLAAQLVRRGRQVILLESGGRELGYFASNTYSVVGRKNEGIQIGRSRGLGGTSNLWGGCLVEFMPVDLDGRNWMHGSRWPVRFEELAPFYPPTYEALGFERSVQRDDDVWKAIARTPPDLGDEVEVLLSRWLNIPNMATLFAAEVEKDPRLIVVLGATVVGLEGDGGRVTAVKVVDDSGGSHVVRGREVVLVAGTIENTRLLLHSANDADWKCPWSGNDNIGRLFQDHLGGRVASVRPRDMKAFQNVFSTIAHLGHKFAPRLRLRDEVLQKEPRLNILGAINFESSIKENLVFLTQFAKAALYSRKIGSLKDLVRNILACRRHVIPLMWKFIVEHRILIPSGSRIVLIVQAEVEPMHESRITIDSAMPDKVGLPKVVLDWRLSGRELSDILDFTRRVDRTLRDAGLADLEIEPALAAADPRFLDQLIDTYHQVGGCVMGESEADGVVDRDLRVFGTDNLYVAGACTFRTTGNANTTFTAMTFAMRLAEHLSKLPKSVGVSGVGPVSGAVTG